MLKMNQSVIVNVLQHNLSVLNYNGTVKELGAVQLFTNYPDGLLVFAAVCCTLFMCIGIPGNLITIIALAKYEKVRNATAISIMNLSCSDLLFCCFNLPLAASTFWQRSWKHGRVLCRMFPYARYSLVAVSLFTVLTITINRYIMISHPNLYPKLYRRRYLVLMLLCTWIFPFGALIPTWFGKWGRFGLDTYAGSCSILPDDHGHSPKRSLFVILSLPLIAIIFCYLRIFYIVRKTTLAAGGPILRKTIKLGQEDSSTTSERRSKSVPCHYIDVSTRDISATSMHNLNNTPADSLQNVRFDMNQTDRSDFLDVPRISNKPAASFRRTVLRKSLALVKLSLPTRKDKKLGTMIMAIMISFCMTHLPITVTKLVHDYTAHPYANIASYILLYMATCINPVIYVVMSNEYRQAYKNLWKCR
ncbi:G-protein coupled receptor moody [Papilio machaon]|uniref:G-protein coupled receptor moody n=1 Tax=Papilio machaon TaxID=76193 RepID=UPI001E6653CF|nr:G-protein coupled receptor moody [Papilio machaon]